jgi:H+/gluconate symporter-like permease
MRSARREPGVSRLGRFVRGRRLDRNPLRRPSDRAESAVLAALVIAFIVAAPFAALACGAWGHAIAHRVQATQQASRYQVPAVVLQVPQASQAAGDAALAPEAEARWTAPDGKVVTVEVPAPLATAVGTVMRVWVTRDGQLTDAPLQDTQVAGQADLAATFGVVALAVTLTVTGVLARRALDKRRMAAWDADWRVTGGHWTRRA